MANLVYRRFVRFSPACASYLPRVCAQSPLQLADSHRAQEQIHRVSQSAQAVRRKIQMRRPLLGRYSYISNASGNFPLLLIFIYFFFSGSSLYVLIQIPRYIIVLHQLITHTSKSSANELKCLENAKSKLEELSRVPKLVNELAKLFFKRQFFFRLCETK